MLLLLAFCALVAADAMYDDSKVLQLTPTTFYDVVGTPDKAAFVEFYAPWCGHCKKLSPEYINVAAAFSRTASVAVAAVDCDAHKDLCSTFGVRGYPTLKWFPKGSLEPEDYSGGRTADDILAHINKAAGVRVKMPSAASAITVLTNENFDEIALDPSRNVFVKFYAPWCGLAPKWEKLASAFSNEPNCVIADLDADEADNKVISGRYGVSGFPTLKFFSTEDKSGDEKYNGPRELDDLVEYVNGKCGTFRLADGSLNADAGRVAELDALIAEFWDDLDAGAAKCAEAAKGLSGDATFYAKLMQKMAKLGKEAAKEFVPKEIQRLTRMLEGSLTPKKVDEFTKRKNVLNLFS